MRTPLLVLCTNSGRNDTLCNGNKLPKGADGPATLAHYARDGGCPFFSCDGEFDTASFSMCGWVSIARRCFPDSIHLGSIDFHLLSFACWSRRSLAVRTTHARQGEGRTTRCGSAVLESVGQAAERAFFVCVGERAFFALGFGLIPWCIGVG